MEIERVTCPWCGTNYTSFRPNCDNCGGSLPLPPERAPEPIRTSILERISAPPPPPRNVPSNQVWRILLMDGGAISGAIFLLIGSIFGTVGAVLTVGIITAFVGLPFALMGLVMFLGGLALVWVRYQKAQRTVDVLREGDAVLGEIEDIYQNLHVQVNGRHPWTIVYRYEVEEQAYNGKVTTLIRPDLRQQPGKQAYVLYWPEDPGQSVIYPHPYGYHGV